MRIGTLQPGTRMETQTISTVNTKSHDLLAISLLWIALLVLIRPWGNFPANDDWSYALAVRNLVTGHRWRLTDFTGVPLATQVVWGTLFSAPFGYSLMALRLSTLVLAWLAILGVYE